MRIDPKYFNKFILIAAVFGAVIIVFFTIHNKQSREQAFKHQLAQADSLRYRKLKQVFSDDSTRIQKYSQSYVVLDFWGSQSGPSRSSHQQLAKLKKQYPDKLTIIAATVRDPMNAVTKYQDKNNYPFIYVDGFKLVRELEVPGIPTQIIFKPGGKIMQTILGYKDSTVYDKLKQELQ